MIVSHVRSLRHVRMPVRPVEQNIRVIKPCRNRYLRVSALVLPQIRINSLCTLTVNDRHRKVPCDISSFR